MQLLWENDRTHNRRTEKTDSLVKPDGRTNPRYSENEEALLQEYYPKNKFENRDSLNVDVQAL